MTNRQTVKDTLTKQFDKLKNCEATMLRAAAEHRTAAEELTDTLWTIYDVVHDTHDPYFLPAHHLTRWLEHTYVENDLRETFPLANYHAGEADRLWKEATQISEEAAQ
jgi:hypothetical protein